MKKVIDFIKNEDGATLPEYALMLGVIAAVALVAIQLIGTNATAQFNTIAGAIAS